MNDDIPNPPPPRRASRTSETALRRALRHRMNDRHLPPANDADLPRADPDDGLLFPLRSIPKWVPIEEK
jgi:hypothetical protein